MQHNNIFAVIFLALFVLVQIGCSNPDSKYMKVDGTITYKGAPVDGATVIFYPVSSEGETASGITDAGGRYTVTSPQAVSGGSGVLPGDYIVTVVKREAAPPDPDQVAFEKNEIDYDELQRRLSAKANAPGAARAAAPKDLLPAKYKQQGTSDLKVTVAAGKVSTHNFTLED